MSDGFHIAPFDERYITEIEQWLDDNGTSRHFLQSFKDPDNLLTAETKYGKSKAAWVGIADNQPVAFANLSVDHNDIGYLTFAVKPSERRHGIAKQMVQSVLEQPEIKQLFRIRGTVEVNNVPAQKVLQSQQFTHMGYDQEGNITFEKQVR